MAETGLIIAAGAGTRLADDTGVPKPLRKVAGIPLLKRIILLGARAGLKRIVVVVGFQKEKIISYIAEEKWPITVETVENPQWKKSNGVSVLAARSAINEHFVLLMSDHIFDHKTLEALRAEDLKPDVAKLVIDYKTQQIFDEDDATKVMVKNDRIVAIDKKLTTFNAIDTGMFLMSPEIFDVLEQAQVNGDCSLSDGIRRLAEQGKMGVFDLKDAYWQDVDNKDCLKEAERVLLKACRKSTDGFISRNFNRHISMAISRVLMNTPITANQFTLFTTVIGLLSGVFASYGTYTWFLAAAILFKVASIFDGVDGELSKLRMTNSVFGAWLDTASDNLTYFAYAVGLTVGLYQAQAEWINVIGPAAILGIILLIAVMILFTKTRSNDGSFLAVQSSLLGDQSQSFLTKIVLKLYFVIKRDFFATFFLALAIFGFNHIILFLVALATNIAWLLVLLQWLKKPAVEK